MKKIFCILILGCLITTTAHAQYFAGGSVSLHAGSNKIGDLKTKSSGFGLSPSLGYYWNEQLAFGLAVSLSGSYSNNNMNLDGPYKTAATTWAIAPFARYSLIEFGKFSVWAEASLNLGMSFSKITHSAIAAIPDDKYTTLQASLNVAPLLSYALSNKINLEAGLKFLNLGYSVSRQKHKETDIVSTSSSFGLGADSNNILNVGNLTIGAVYKF